MAGSPPKPPPPPVGSSSSEPPPLPFLGYHPSYEELVDSYLRPRVVSGTKAAFIHEADLYSTDPYQLTGNHAAAMARTGGRAWYFYTRLRLKGSANKCVQRNVDTGRKGNWVGSGSVNDNVSKGQRLIGRRLGFAFEEKVDGKGVRSAWRMTELRLDPNVVGQEVGSPDFLVLSKVYLSPHAIAEDVESSMAVAKAEAEGAGPGRKRKAGDKDSGAETVASSPGRQNKADGESADSKDPVEAAEQAEQEEPRDSRFYNFFDDSSAAPLDAPEEAEQEPRDPRDPPPFYDFFSDSQNPKKR